MAISDVQLPAGVNAHAFKSPVLLAEGLALNVAKQLSEAIAARGNAVLVVSGGRSPVAFFQHLAKQELDWSKVVVTLADERWVPVEHADSNAGLLKQYLLKGPAAKAQFLSLYSAAASVEQAAEQADRLLAELPPIDVLVLGMGDDISGVPVAVRDALREQAIGIEIQSTGSAVRTYNVLMDEGRAVAAALIAVDKAR